MLAAQAHPGTTSVAALANLCRNRSACVAEGRVGPAAVASSMLLRTIAAQWHASMSGLPNTSAATMRAPWLTTTPHCPASGPICTSVSISEPGCWTAGERGPATVRRASMARICGRPEFGPRPAKEARRYVPLPSYHDHVAAVWRRGRTSPTAYRISGFRRRLPDGQQPSDWALSNAPAHIRAVMEADETFVRDHVRGGHEEMERLRMYLSKYSLLADTVGLARRR